jgi:dsDNA-specific endonuclease/ATPase MutS2
MADLYITVDAGMLEPNTKVELESIQPKGMGELPEYCFQLLYFRKSATQLEEPVQKEIRISPVKFFKASSFVKNNYFNTPALLIKLADHPLKAELDKLSDKEFQQITLTKEPKKPAPVELPKTDLVEIDLHIHQLLDDFSGLTNADMLKLQLETFRKEMDKAIATGVKKIVFIHGVGDGVLKNELRRELQRKYPRFPYQDASFREYGFGATMAVLRR